MSSDAGESSAGSNTGYGPNTKGTLSDAFGTNTAGYGNTGIGTGVSAGEQASIESQLAPDLSVEVTPEVELLSLNLNPKAKRANVLDVAMKPNEYRAIRDAIDQERAAMGAAPLDRDEMEQGTMSPEQTAAISAARSRDKNASINDAIGAIFGSSVPAMTRGMPTFSGLISSPMALEMNPSAPLAEEFGYGTPSPFDGPAPSGPAGSSEGLGTPLWNYGVQPSAAASTPPTPVNTPVPLTPWDYQEQQWVGNTFTPAPLRRFP